MPEKYFKPVMLLLCALLFFSGYLIFTTAYASKFGRDSMYFAKYLGQDLLLSQKILQGIHLLIAACIIVLFVFKKKFVR